VGPSSNKAAWLIEYAIGPDSTSWSSASPSEGDSSRAAKGNSVDASLIRAPDNQRCQRSGCGSLADALTPLFDLHTWRCKVRTGASGEPRSPRNPPQPPQNAPFPHQKSLQLQGGTLFQGSRAPNLRSPFFTQRVERSANEANTSCQQRVERCWLPICDVRSEGVSSPMPRLRLQANRGDYSGEGD
jgi:hypothetical protein